MATTVNQYFQRPRHGYNPFWIQSKLNPSDPISITQIAINSLLEDSFESPVSTLAVLLAIGAGLLLFCIDAQRE